MLDPLLESWRFNQATNEKLLALIPDAHLEDSYGVRTRNVARTFAHLHHIRLQWLAAGGLDQKEGLERIGRAEGKTVEILKSHLQRSSEVMEVLLGNCIASGEVPDFPGSPFHFVNHLIAHEAHHRGQIIVSLRLGGLLLGAEGIHSLWDWWG